jgi:threonine dehydratase
VGGGGLIAGRIIGVEPKRSRALDAALAAGQPVDVAVDSVAAHSLGARRASRLPFALAKRQGERVVLVEDQAIVEAQVQLWQALRIASEPGRCDGRSRRAVGPPAGAYRSASASAPCSGAANVDLSRFAALPPRPPPVSA